MMKTDTALSFRLAPHVRACLVGSDVILLDLAADRYIGYSGECDDLSAIVADWPARGPRAARVSEAGLEMLGELREKGYLVQATPETLTRATALQPGDAALIEGYESWDVRVRVCDVVGVVAAVVSTKLLLRYASLHWLVARVARRNAYSTQCAGAEDADQNLARVRERVVIFSKLRPFLFRAQDACLFDSLALLRFLRWCGLTATLKIGVRVEPFGAHSWLQIGSVVVNDSPDFTSRYTVILTA